MIPGPVPSSGRLFGGGQRLGFGVWGLGFRASGVCVCVFLCGWAIFLGMLLFFLVLVGFCKPRKTAKFG